MTSSRRGGTGSGHAGLAAPRRGYHARPPQGEPDEDPRYAALPPEARPRGESLHDVTRRLLPYWYDAIVPDLRQYSCVLVVSHGNTLRALDQAPGGGTLVPPGLAIHPYRTTVARRGLGP